ncbi:hypothetical protein D3C72_1886540 [compost metagenome]
MGRGEHEADPHVLDATCHLLRGEIEVDPGGLEQIGASALARNRAVAVLGHPATGRRDDEGRRGGDVEDIHAVATGTTGIDQVFGVDLHRRG